VRLRAAGCRAHGVPRQPADERPPGFYVVTPLLLGPPEAVLVQRGWVPRDIRRDRTLPSVPRRPAWSRCWATSPRRPRGCTSSRGARRGVIRQNLDLAAFSRESGLALRPVGAAGRFAGTAGDGLLRQWPRPAVDVHKHYGYAFQWFACAP
jgi:surfeit locus 1 family protein